VATNRPHPHEDARPPRRRAWWRLGAFVLLLGGVACLVLRRRRRATLPHGAPSFARAFEVAAPVERVAAFHEGPDALRRLQPPGSGATFHRVDPLGEGSVTEFTMGRWPLAIRWRAVHRDVTPGLGFTDVQVAGPMREWLHRHEYRALDRARTRVSDRIWYRHPDGPRGIATRLIFNPVALGVLFRYRAHATRCAVRAGG
jgi:ligand-binding SRPBCC domain-containing protein